ncbi:MAG TPA: phosphatase PAP2 family protein [Gemmatimonadales bacterium]|nr:phosphatase PAP2 family protein [Gemmatimonadales bacterium]
MKSVSPVHVAVTAGALLAVSLADRPIRDYLQRHRSAGKDDVAKIFKDMGEPDVYAPVPLGLIAVGVISGNHRITRAGGRITAGLLTAGTITNLLKPIGRVRPKFADGAYEFTPLKGSYSWPSGHATMAFALATGISDEVHFLPLTIGLYGAAVTTGWSRMNDNRHWLTDVLGGMMIGITSAKVMNGRWSFLGITGPGFLQEPDRRSAKENRAHLLLTPGGAGLSMDF